MILNGERLRERRDHNGRAWLAFHAAYLPRLKRPIKLRKLLMKTSDRRRAARPWQHQKASIEQWMAASGGRIVKKAD